jgi:hypothetical protein
VLVGPPWSCTTSPNDRQTPAPTRARGRRRPVPGPASWSARQWATRSADTG